MYDVYRKILQEKWQSNWARVCLSKAKSLQAAAAAVNEVSQRNAWMNERSDSMDNGAIVGRVA